jgi:hypothetical protein
MEQDETADPADIGLLGPGAVVAHADGRPNPVQQLEGTGANRNLPSRGNPIEPNRPS